MKSTIALILTLVICLLAVSCTGTEIGDGLYPDSESDVKTEAPTPEANTSPVADDKVWQAVAEVYKATVDGSGTFSYRNEYTYTRITDRYTEETSAVNTVSFNEQTLEGFSNASGTQSFKYSDGREQSGQVGRSALIKIDGGYYNYYEIFESADEKEITLNKYAVDYYPQVEEKLLRYNRAVTVSELFSQWYNAPDINAYKDAFSRLYADDPNASVYVETLEEDDGSMTVIFKNEGTLSGGDVSDRIINTEKHTVKDGKLITSEVTYDRVYTDGDKVEKFLRTDKVDYFESFDTKGFSEVDVSGTIRSENIYNSASDRVTTGNYINIEIMCGNVNVRNLHLSEDRELENKTVDDIKSYVENNTGEYAAAWTYYSDEKMTIPIADNVTVDDLKALGTVYVSITPHANKAWVEYNMKSSLEKDIGYDWIKFVDHTVYTSNSWDSFENGAQYDFVTVENANVYVTVNGEKITGTGIKLEGGKFYSIEYVVAYDTPTHWYEAYSTR